MKRCTKCGEVKELDCFYKNKNNKDGMDYLCKNCNNEYQKKWKEKNPEKYKESTKQTRIKRKEKIKKYKRKIIDVISKTYVATKLKIKTSELTDDLYQLKKQQIEVHRFIKQLNKEIKNGNQ